MHGLFPTNDHSDELTTLITKSRNILKEREETWRLRSKAIWLKEGDDNSKFFHKFANGRKAINTIWKLTNEQGIGLDTFSQLATLATSHFKQVYQAPPNATLAEVIRVAQLFPRFVNQENDMDLNREVTLGELEATLKWFKRDKSPAPDDWSVEFYLAFFHILGEYLLKVVEECRIFG